MTLLQLKYALTAAECKTVSEAAKKLYISQPSLTSAIKELEDELGITIFNRTNKGIIISAEGEEFLGYARQVIEQTNLINDLAAAYRTVIKELYAAGCRNIQFDDCTWGMIVDDKYWAAKVGDGFTLKDEAEKYLKVNNLAIEGKPDDLTITTHVCRGNYHSTYASKGAYDAVAPYLFAKENADAFYLEFDDERSGGFEPLKYVSDNKKVVLGLITTKSPVLENKETVIARIKEAAKYIPLDRLYLSPQCGFASCEIGNKLTAEQQWAKLALVKEIAEEVWGN